MDDNSKYTGAYADLLTQVAENVEAVYAAGVKSEYDRFWDEFQQNGKRTHYAYAFAGYCWNDKILVPKYPIKVVDPDKSYRRAIGMFYYFRRVDDTPYDMTEICKRIDFSQVRNFTSMFNNAHTINITIDASNAETMSQCFQSGDGGSNNYITVTVSEKCTEYYHAFYYLTSLTDVTFTEGSVIAANIDFIKSTKLTHESLMSIINALKDFSGTSETRTCTLGEANLAKLTDAEKAIATEKGWTLA